MVYDKFYRVLIFVFASLDIFLRKGKYYVVGIKVSYDNRGFYLKKKKYAILQLDSKLKTYLPNLDYLVCSKETKMKR